MIFSLYFKIRIRFSPNGSVRDNSVRVSSIRDNSVRGNDYMMENCELESLNLSIVSDYSVYSLILKSGIEYEVTRLNLEFDIRCFVKF